MAEFPTKHFGYEENQAVRFLIVTPSSPLIYQYHKIHEYHRQSHRETSRPGEKKVGNIQGSKKENTQNGLSVSKQGNTGIQTVFRLQNQGFLAGYGAKNLKGAGIRPPHPNRHQCADSGFFQL
jgi:hypothetical protein